MKKVIILILAILVILISFFIFKSIFYKSDTPNFDLISGFEDAVKEGFPEKPHFKEALPDNFPRFDYELIHKEAVQLITSGGIKCEVDTAGNELGQNKISNGVFRWKYIPGKQDNSVYSFRFHIINTLNFFEIKVIPAEGNLKISKHATGRENVIDTLNYDFKSEDGIILYVMFFEDYLLLFDNNSLLFQMKSTGLKTTGTVKYLQLKGMTGTDAVSVLKFSRINEESVTGFMHWNKEIMKKLPEHRFNFVTKAKTWNALGKNDQLIGYNESSDYLVRLKRGSEVSPAIWLPMGAKLRYRISIPASAIFSFSLTAVDYYIKDPSRLVFVLKIEGKKKKKELKIPFTELVNKDEFVHYSVGLEDFKGMDVNLSVSVCSIDGKFQKDEEKVILALASPVVYKTRQKKEKNLLLISLDTLRGDHLGCYGYKRDTTPNIDKLAQKGIRYLNATSNSNWTLPSHMSLFTGRYPYETGYVRKPPFYRGAFIANNLQTIAGYLKEKGFYTFSINGGVFISEDYGFDKGFYRYIRGGLDIKDAITTTIENLEQVKNSRFFLFYHTYQIHSPYTDTYFLEKESSSNMSHTDKVIAAYDGDIRYTDFHISRIFDWLKKNNLFEDTLVIITSDHGENFDLVTEDTLIGNHGYTMLDSETKIPLIILNGETNPESKEIITQVSNVDILPTILNYFDIDPEEQYRGKSLLSKDILREKPDRSAYSEATRIPIEFRSLRTTKYKFIAHFREAKKEQVRHFTYDESPLILYDLAADPGEKKNIFKEHMKQVKTFQVKLNQIIKSIQNRQLQLVRKSSSERENMDELKKELKNLGYLGN